MMFIIKERDNIIFTMDSAELADKMCADNDGSPMIRADIEAMFAHYKKDGAEDIIVDMESVADENELDAAAVKAVFWLYAVLTKFGCMKNISMPVQMKLMPKVMRMISANTAASSVKARKTNSIMSFVQTYISEREKAAADPAYSIGTAVQNIIDVLPDVNVAREEYSKRPNFLQFVDSVVQLAKGCADSEYSEIIENFREEIIK